MPALLEVAICRVSAGHKAHGDAEHAGRNRPGEGEEGDPGRGRGGEAVRAWHSLALPGKQRRGYMPVLSVQIPALSLLAI